MHRWLPALLIVALLAALRVLSSAFPALLPNILPLPAVVLCSVIFLKGAMRWLLPLAIWLVTDPVTSLMQGYPVFGPHHIAIAFGIAATVFIAKTIGGNPRPFALLGATLASALSFYFLTNLVSFIGDPLYAKSFEGLVQAQWTGPAGFGPTWIFLRNLLIGNMVFTSLFIIARQSLPLPVKAASPELAR